MRVFKTKVFARWAEKAGLSDTTLLEVVVQMERGLIDVDLGGNLFKKRIALPGRGKSGSARTIIATRFEGVLFFLYGFEKSSQENISNREIVIYRRVASDLLRMPEDRISLAIQARELMKVSGHEPND